MNKENKYMYIKKFLTLDNYNNATYYTPKWMKEFTIPKSYKTDYAGKWTEEEVFNTCVEKIWDKLLIENNFEISFVGDFELIKNEHWKLELISALMQQIEYMVFNNTIIDSVNMNGFDTPNITKGRIHSNFWYDEPYQKLWAIGFFTAKSLQEFIDLDFSQLATREFIKKIAQIVMEHFDDTLTEYTKENIDLIASVVADKIKVDAKFILDIKKLLLNDAELIKQFEDILEPLIYEEVKAKLKKDKDFNENISKNIEDLLINNQDFLNLMKDKLYFDFLNDVEFVSQITNKVEQLLTNDEVFKEMLTIAIEKAIVNDNDFNIKIAELLLANQDFLQAIIDIVASNENIQAIVQSAIKGKVNGVENEEGNVVIDFDQYFYANTNTGNGKETISISDFESSLLGAETGYVDETGKRIDSAVQTMIETAVQVESVRTTKQDKLFINVKNNGGETTPTPIFPLLNSGTFANATQETFVQDAFNNFDPNVEKKEFVSAVIKRLLDRIVALENKTLTQDDFNKMFKVAFENFDLDATKKK